MGRITALESYRVMWKRGCQVLRCARRDLNSPSPKVSEEQALDLLFSRTVLQAGFEPATPCSPAKRDGLRQVRYCAPGGT
jgi:hypothetical protein